MAMNISASVSQQDRAKLESNEWRVKNQIPWNATEGDTRGNFQYKGGQWGYSGGGGAEGQGSGSGAYSGRSAEDLQRSQFKLSQELQAPAIDTLRQSGQGIGERYQRRSETLEAERQPLKDRYQNMLKDITQGTRQAAASEFSRRGIPLSSGLVEQTVGSRLAPQIERVGLERESGLRNLTGMQNELVNQQSQEEQQLQQAIAMVQSQSGSQGMQSGMSLYQLAQQVAEQQQNRDLSRWQTGQQTNLANQQMGFQQSQADIAQQNLDRAWPYQQATYQKALDKPYYKGDSPSQYDKTVDARNQMLDQAQKGATLTQLTQQFGGAMDVADIVKLYAGASPYGVPEEPWAKKILGIDQGNNSGGSGFTPT